MVKLKRNSVKTFEETLPPINKDLDEEEDRPYKETTTSSQTHTHPKPDPTPYNNENNSPQPVATTSRDESAEKLRKELEASLTEDLKTFVVRLIEKKKSN